MSTTQNISKKSFIFIQQLQSCNDVITAVEIDTILTFFLST